jgi:acyl carrier protein
MPSADLNARLLKVFKDLFQYTEPEIPDDASPDTVPAWDSLQHLMLVQEIEGTFDVHLSTDDIMQMTNAGEIRKIIARHLDGIGP